MEFLVSSPETILVTTPEPASITDSYALLKALSMNEDFDPERSRVRLVANKVDNEHEGQSLYDKLSAVSSRFLNIDLEYLGAVPFDNSVTKSVMNQKPVTLMYPNASSTKCYEDIVNVLENKEILPHNNIGIRNFFKTVFSRKVNG
jgi:flagellar biosynthesis protein FlhG